MPRRPRVRVIEASAACSDRDTLHSNELCGRSNITLDLQAQLDGLTNTLDELVERACLSVATGQLWNTGHVVALFITLHDDAELAFAVLSHGDGMTEKRWLRKAASGRPAWVTW